MKLTRTPCYWCRWRGQKGQTPAPDILVNTYGRQFTNSSKDVLLTTCFTFYAMFLSVGDPKVTINMIIHIKQNVLLIFSITYYLHKAFPWLGAAAGILNSHSGTGVPLVTSAARNPITLKISDPFPRARDEIYVKIHEMKFKKVNPNFIELHADTWNAVQNFVKVVIEANNLSFEKNGSESTQ